MSALRVAILGAESTGKSTLAAALAARHGTVWVPEYLREFVDTHGRVPVETDQIAIARTQVEREEAAAGQARGLLFCDTTPLMTALYSQWYWGRVDPDLAVLAAHHDYACTFVTAPDAPWEADGLMRESDAVRQAIHARVIEALDQRRIGYVLLRGTLEQRMAVANALLTS